MSATLTTKESLTLQAMVLRAGMAAVLDDISLLCQELAAADEAWQDVTDALYEACQNAPRGV